MCTGDAIGLEIHDKDRDDLSRSMLSEESKKDNYPLTNNDSTEKEGDGSNSGIERLVCRQDGDDAKSLNCEVRSNGNPANEYDESGNVETVSDSVTLLQAEVSSFSSAFHEEEFLHDKDSFDHPNGEAQQLTSVFNQLYGTPYSQYGPDVESVLNYWLDTASNLPLEYENFAIAEAISQLGVVHRNIADKHLKTILDTEQLVNNGIAGKGTLAQFQEARTLLKQQIDWSVRAFRLALQYYEGLENSDSANQEWFQILKNLHLAVCYFNLGDVLTLYRDEKHDGLYKDYFLHSHQLFSGASAALMENPPSLQEMTSLFLHIYNDGFGADTAVAEFWNEARLTWARCCNHLGVAELDSRPLSSGAHTGFSDGRTARSLSDFQTMATNALRTFSDVNSLDEQSQALSEMIRVQIPKFLASADRAEAYFQQSITLYRKIVEESHNGEQDLATLRSLETALQNLAASLVSKGDFERGVKFYEEALEIARKAITLDPNDPDFEGSVQDDKHGLVVAIGDILYSLANPYLQLGNYDKSQESYQQVMTWYEEHNLRAPQEEAMISDEAFIQSIAEYERALEEYQEKLASTGSDNVVVAELDDETDFYEQDFGFEADLHSTLGALYLSTGDLMEAAVHISQALQLYIRIGEYRESHYADAKHNQALLLFRQERFEESSKAYSEALEIQRKISGDGVNPFAEDIDLLSLQSLLDGQYGVKEQTQQPPATGSGSGSQQHNTATHVDVSGATEKQNEIAGKKESLRLHEILYPSESHEEAQNRTEVLNEILPIRQYPKR